MAKDDPKKDDPKPWTPADPLEDEEDEKEVQRRARANARLRFLEDSVSKPADPKKDKKERKGLFS